MRSAFKSQGDCLWQTLDGAEQYICRSSHFEIRPLTCACVYFAVICLSEAMTLAVACLMRTRSSLISSITRSNITSGSSNWDWKPEGLQTYRGREAWVLGGRGG